MNPALKHVSVMLEEVLKFLPQTSNARFLDVTAGGGGHFFEMLQRRPGSFGECWDRDPDAKQRIDAKGQGQESRYKFVQKTFGEAPSDGISYHYILADLGISSFQLDDPARGLSFHSAAPADFRMNPHEGPNFAEWLQKKTVKELEEILVKFGEELRAKKIAPVLKNISPATFSSAKQFADELMNQLHLRVKKNESHPLTRVFQALRIAVNGELSELEELLKWAPKSLAPGGRLAIITFHSLEDRKVKRGFEAWEENSVSELKYKILTPKALTPSEEEVSENPRSRSAKLRVLERVR